MPIRNSDTTPAQLQCPVCHTTLEVRLARGRKSGKTFLMAICPTDGRHIRCFINDRDYVRGILDRLEDKP